MNYNQEREHQRSGIFERRSGLPIFEGYQQAVFYVIICHTDMVLN
jgi:hypothetical protein